ncbi:MAG: O-antigen ligase family protein, partial [Marinobacter sp.]|uniref:O-antigen ligase family protein n=1 Tax=Marinobacter sp. TaxID=50741 RepID=UPI003297EBDE
TFTWIALLIDHPEIARSGPSLEDYLDKFAFLIVAIALGGKSRNLTALVFLVAALIFMIPWVLGGGVDDFFHGVRGGREGLGLNPIRTALYLSLIVLGLLAFRKRFFGINTILSFGTLIWMTLFLLSIGTLLMTQTRGVLACLVLVILVFGLYGVLRKRKIFLRNKFRAGLSLLAFLLLLLVGAQTDLAGTNYEKFSRELSTVDTILDGDLEDLPNSSWGLRAQFWVVGVKWISERPLAGWGYRAGRYVLEQESRTNKQFKHYRQLHNSYLELTVRYGLGGLFIMLSLFGWVLYQSNQACKRGSMSKELRNFTFTSVALFMLTANFYGLFFDDVYGLHVMTLLLGIPVSFIFKGLQAQRVERLPPDSLKS